MALTEQTHTEHEFSMKNARSSAVRYAVYVSPEPGTPLADFGRTWFGYDAETGETVHERQSYGLGQDVTEAITRVPRHYGLHATLRAPFRLRPQADEAALAERAECVARGLRPLSLAPLALQRLGRFLALCPSEPCPELDQMHAHCLFAFEAFRAAPAAIGRARRLGGTLSPNQRLLSAQWGYPYVLDEFRFHITLTGRLSDHDQARVAPALVPALKDICQAPLDVGSLCLFAESDDGRPFRLLVRFPLGL